MEKQPKLIFPELEITVKVKNKNAKKQIVRGSSQAAEILTQMFKSDTIDWNEEMIILYFNRANACIGMQKHSSGGTAGVLVDVKNIFIAALHAGAHSIIMAHNHPSGSLVASQADIDITKKVQKAGEILEIKLLDHIIIVNANNGEKNYSSMADDGII